MNKLMFVASGVTIGMVVGCSTTTVTVPASGANDGSGAAKSIEVSSASKSIVERVLPLLKEMIERNLRAKVADKKFYSKYLIPSDAEIQKLADGKLSETDLVALRKVAEEYTRAGEKSIVWPAWIADIKSRMLPSAEEALKSGEYEKCREVIWRSSTTMVPEVDEVIREVGYEFLNARVNPAQWKMIEAELTANVGELEKAGKYDEAIAFLKGYPRIRTYSKNIDSRLKDVQDEVVKLGVSAEGIEPVRAKTGELVAVAAKILDKRDSVTNSVNSTSREVSPAFNPDLAEYERKLAEYHETLIRYNCTKENADRIVAEFKKDIDPLLRNLSKEAVNEVKTDKKEFLYLGTMAVNIRIDRFVVKMTDKLTKAKEAADKAAREKQIAEAVRIMKEKVAALVAEGKYEEAREVIWQSAATGDAEIDAVVFVQGLELLRKDVNPSHWIAIETEIRTYVSGKIKSNEYDECIKFLKAYPRIRQHSVMLDNQLKRVQAEAEALGVSPEEAAKYAMEACMTVAETADLVDHLDAIENAQKPSDDDRSAYLKELAAYKEKLCLYHANRVDATAIAERLDAALRKLMRKPGEPMTKLILGTNGVNDKLAKLIEEQLAIVLKAKSEWQEKRYAELYSSLIERVRKAVAKKDFAAARQMIRDEALVGDPIADAKLYVLRVGLLDSCVNPAQLDFLLAEIEEKVKAFVAKKDYKGFDAFVKNYPYVHDDYAKIDAALAQVKKAMLDLGIPEQEANYDEKVRFADSIREILENRREAWSPERDMKPLEEALTEVEKSIYEHLNVHTDIIKAERVSEYKHVLADIAALDRAITTSELNDSLRARLSREEPVIAEGLARKAYLDELSKIDSEVSFDAQIAMAEEAISRQLGQTCPRASYRINAVLGEYARAFRLLKKSAKLSKSEATSIVLGAAYLEQGAVIPYAIKLGADVNGVSSRDPLKRTALMLAIDAQNHSIVKKLVESGASSVATDANGNAVLHYAVKSGSVTIVRAIAKAAPMDVVNAAGETPLFEAVKRNQAVLAQSVIALVDAGKRAAFVNVANAKGMTAMAVAAKLGSRDVLDVLSGAGAKFSERELILAEEGDHLAVVQWLVSQGADVNAAGVMDKACPAKETGRYLRREGGVGDHTCEVCKPKDKCADSKCAKSQKTTASEANKIDAKGTITFQVSGSDKK